MSDQHNPPKLTSLQIPPLAPLPPTSREFKFTDQDFDRVKKMIYDYAGIALSDGKQDMVYGRLAKRLRHHKLASFADYLSMLERGNAAEWEAFINSLTTNLTSFFREGHHFPVLADLLKAHKGDGQLNIWCAASSTGEEPYTLAMTACEAFDTLRPNVRIVATDLDTNVLKIAEAGIYPADRFEKITPAQKQRFFNVLPDGQFQVKQELRSLITFRRQNLIDATWQVRGPLDAIFCRNVMIYFDRQTQLNILQRFMPMLKPHGLLFVGHSENLYQANHLFSLVGKTVYKLANAPK
ncbi:chemotaxis protein CheR [Burkholderiaceae bacterium DAT-1]|nr:chemotaxis protein CheR [Burkholderiaceae bacterium DAT-1]